MFSLSLSAPDFFNTISKAKVRSNYSPVDNYTQVVLREASNKDKSILSIDGLSLPDLLIGDVSSGFCVQSSDK